MAGVHNSPNWSQSGVINELVAGESCHIVLESSPPDYVEKISRYLDNVSNIPADAESDSGDSLFITQKPVPLAVRSRRGCHHKLRSKPSCPRDLEESEKDTSSSTSDDGEPNTDKERRRTLPKYSFPFLTKQKCKQRSTLLPEQHKWLHYYAMGGFFKCVGELWQGSRREDLKSSLPTADMKGEDIPPLSEGDEGRSDDEDIKVVEKKLFVVPSKAKSRQTWCNQLKPQRKEKASKAKQETPQGRQSTVSRKIPVETSISKVIPMDSDTERSDNGESSSRVLVQRKRDDEHSDRNVLPHTEKLKTKRCLTQGGERVIVLQGAEPHKLWRSQRQSTQKGRETPTLVTEPQTDVLHTDDHFQTGATRNGPESQHLIHSLSNHVSDTNSDRVCDETEVKKKIHEGDDERVEDVNGQSQEEGLRAAAFVSMEVEESPSMSEDNGVEPPAAQASDELQFNGKNGMENSSRDDNILRQEERNVPDSKLKKKRRKKKKSAAENVGQEVDGNLESDVRAEDSVSSVSCNMENGGKEKKKKRKRSSEDVEQIQSNARPLNDDAEMQKKKKKKKKKKEVGTVITEECEEEETSNKTSDLPTVSTEQSEESGNHLENAAASQETFESSNVKRKKHKKKRQSSSNEDGEEGVDVGCLDDSVTMAKSSEMPLKKNKKAALEGINISYTPEENENVDNIQKTKEDENAELVIKKKKKKKKKMSEIFSRENKVVQSDDSVSVREKEKKRTSSFLIADAKENDAQTHADKKKKKKRRMLVEQDSVENDRTQDFKEPDKSCQSTLPETSDTGVKRKKKHKGSESESATLTERLNGAADTGFSPTDEDVVLKKKKKKKRKDEPCHVIEKGPPSATQDVESVTLNTCSSFSPKKKGKHGRSAEISHDSSASDQATKETLDMVERASASSETPGNQALNGMRDEKKKKMKSAHNVSVEGKSLTESAELEPRDNEKKEGNKPSPVPSVIFSSPITSKTSLLKTEMPSSDSIEKNKHRKVKRRLHNPFEDFLTNL